MTTLYLEHWPAKGSRRASLLLLHGLGEHGRRHARTAEWLAAAGVEVRVPDLPGHGRSPGRRGDAPGIEWLLDTLEPHWAALDPAQPRFLYGHSFGGLLATLLCLRHVGECAGLVLSSPFFGLAREPALWRRLAASVLLRLAPALPLPTGLDASALARDQSVVDAYRADPLVHDRLSARLYAAIRSSQAGLEARLRGFPVPVLHWHGRADRLTGMGASAALASHWPSPHSRFIPVADGLHELLNDPVGDDLRKTLAEWLSAQIEATR